MKLLLTSATAEDIFQKADLLRSKGIAVYISDQRASYVKTGIDKGLWVLVDAQFEDANELIRNPRHVVSRPLTEQEMNIAEINARNSFSLFVDKLFSWFMYSFLGIFFLFFLYKVFY